MTTYMLKLATLRSNEMFSNRSADRIFAPAISSFNRLTHGALKTA